MKFYKTKKGFVCCANYHSDYFEKNFKYINSFEIKQPILNVPKNPKIPYDSMTKKEILQYLNKVIQQYDTYKSNLIELKKYIENKQ